MNSFYIKVSNKKDRLAVLGWFEVLFCKTEYYRSTINYIYIKRKPLFFKPINGQKKVRRGFDIDLKITVDKPKISTQLPVDDFLDSNSIEEACKKAGGNNEN